MDSTIMTVVAAVVALLIGLLAGKSFFSKSNNKIVEEAKLHFSDPNARINVYYIPPRLQREGKVQNLAHNIPYKALEPFIQALTKKYTNLRPEYIEWQNVATDSLSKYGEKLDESQDYLEEK